MPCQQLLRFPQRETMRINYEHKPYFQSELYDRNILLPTTNFVFKESYFSIHKHKLLFRKQSSVDKIFRELRSLGGMNTL